MKIFTLDYTGILKREKHIFRTYEGAKSMRNIIFAKILLNTNTKNELSKCINLFNQNKIEEAIEYYNDKTFKIVEFKITEYDLPPDDSIIAEAEELANTLAVKDVLE